jgi:acyl carrier protein
MNPAPSIEDQLKDFLAKNLLFSGDGFPYSDDASFLGEGINDSLGVMQLVEFVGKQFGITVVQTEVTPEHFDSIRRLGAFVRRKQNPKPS